MLTRYRENITRKYLTYFKSNQIHRFAKAPASPVTTKALGPWGAKHNDIKQR